MHLSFHVHIIQVLTSIYYIDVPGTGIKQRGIISCYKHVPGTRYGATKRGRLLLGQPGVRGNG